MRTLQTRAVEATARFCERRGYEVLDVSWESPTGARADVVADDAGVICFVEVTSTERPDRGFADGRADRGSREAAAACWLAERGTEAGVTVRFDRCDVIAIGSDRAFIRYCTNALAEG